jgi:hypothetical protein
MTQQTRFEVGRIYFSLLYADPDITLPIVHSYQYIGESIDRPGVHKFKLLGADGVDNLSEDDAESLVGVVGLADSLARWARQNPGLCA